MGPIATSIHTQTGPEEAKAFSRVGNWIPVQYMSASNTNLNARAADRRLLTSLDVPLDDPTSRPSDATAVWIEVAKASVAGWVEAAEAAVALDAPISCSSRRPHPASDALELWTTLPALSSFGSKGGGRDPLAPVAPRALAPTGDAAGAATVAAAAAAAASGAAGVRPPKTKSAGLGALLPTGDLAAWNCCVGARRDESGGDAVFEGVGIENSASAGRG